MTAPNVDMLDAMRQIAELRGIPVQTLFEALANALETAYKRMPGAWENSWVDIDPDTGDYHIWAQELDAEGAPLGEEFEVEKDEAAFGRIAAQTAKQVMSQRIREVERDQKYEEYAGREGDIVTGIIQQSDHRYTLLDLGKVEALLPQAEQVPHERYERGARLKAYIVEVRKTTKGPQIVVSRTHPGLIKRLFELEVPEIVERRRRDQGLRPRARPPHQDRRLVERPERRPRRRLRRRPWRPRPHGHQRAARREGRHRPLLRGPGRVRDAGPAAGQGQGGPPRRRDRHRHRHRPRLPAVARHRPGGPERPPRRPPHGLGDRDQVRDAAGRGGGVANRTGPRASGSTTRPARWCGSRPRAARPCRRGLLRRAAAWPRPTDADEATPTTPIRRPTAADRRRRPPPALSTRPRRDPA